MREAVELLDLLRLSIKMLLTIKPGGVSARPKWAGLTEAEQAALLKVPRMRGVFILHIIRLPARNPGVYAR